MDKDRWDLLQTLAVGGFLLVWLVGLVALGLAFVARAGSSTLPAPAGGEIAAAPTATTPAAAPTATPGLSEASLPAAIADLPPTWTPTPTDTPSPTRMPTPTRTPTPTPTRTPTPRPVIVVPTMPPPFPTFAPSRATPEPVLPIPTMVPPVPVAENAINIAVLGSDRRPNWSEWHTDVIQIVSVQTDRPAVTVLSVPRDLYVYIPNFWMSRINFADFYGDAYGYPGGGPALLRDTLLYNLGIRVDYFARTEFDGLIGIVDTLGGIDVPVHCRLTDHWPYTDTTGAYPIVTMEPGVQHMDGETALWYARSRLTTSAFSRERRQQQVLLAIWQRGRDIGVLTRIPELWDQTRGMVVTDLGLPEVVRLGQVAILLPAQNVRFYNISRDMVTPWVTPYGGSVYLPNWEAIQPVVTDAMAPIPESRLNRTYMPVEVWNGTPNADWDRLAADRLVRAGFPAVLGAPDRRDYPQTLLIVYSEYAKGTGLGYLQDMFDVPNERVSYEPGGGNGVGFRLILGADYQTCYP